MITEHRTVSAVSLPASIQARLFAAFGLELLYNKEDHQVTIYATITPSTPMPLADHR